MIATILHTFVIVLSATFVAQDTLRTYGSFPKAVIAASATLLIMALIYSKFGIILPFGAFLYYCHESSNRSHHFDTVVNYFVALWALIALYHVSVYMDGNFLYMLPPYIYVIAAYRHFNVRYRDECGALTMALLTLVPMFMVYCMGMYLFAALIKLVIDV